MHVKAAGDLFIQSHPLICYTIQTCGRLPRDRKSIGTGCVRSKWTKLNSYFRQKTCRKFYSNGIFIITWSWNLICHHKNSEKNYTSPSKSLSKLDFPFWNNCFLLVLCTVCYEFYSDFECLIWFFSEFLWFDMKFHDLLIIKIPFE